MNNKIKIYIGDISIETLEHLASQSDCTIEQDGKNSLHYNISGEELTDIYGFGVRLGRERETQLMQKESYRLIADNLFKNKVKKDL